MPHHTTLTKSNLVFWLKSFISSTRNVALARLRPALATSARMEFRVYFSRMSSLFKKFNCLFQLPRYLPNNNRNDNNNKNDNINNDDNNK